MEILQALGAQCKTHTRRCRAVDFLSIELRYHPLIPNRTCHVNVATNEGDCPIFEDIRFEDIVVTGAVRAGDIAGFKGDLLRGLTFKNLTFRTKPKTGWSCGYVDMDSFSAVGVAPPLKCTNGPAGYPGPTCVAALVGAHCKHGPGVRGCLKCLGCHSPHQGGCNGTEGRKAGCSDVDMETWCHTTPPI